MALCEDRHLGLWANLYRFTHLFVIAMIVMVAVVGRGDVLQPKEA